MKLLEVVIECDASCGGGLGFSLCTESDYFELNTSIFEGFKLVVSCTNSMVSNGVSEGEVEVVDEWERWVLRFIKEEGEE